MSKKTKTSGDNLSLVNETGMDSASVYREDAKSLVWHSTSQL